MFPFLFSIESKGFESFFRNIEWVLIALGIVRYWNRVEGEVEDGKMDSKTITFVCLGFYALLMILEFFFTSKFITFVEMIVWTMLIYIAAMNVKNIAVAHKDPQQELKETWFWITIASMNFKLVFGIMFLLTVGNWTIALKFLSDLAFMSSMVLFQFIVHWESQEKKA